MRNKTFLLCLFSVFIHTQVLFSQEIKIQGKVISSDDRYALPGVNIVIKGTTDGTITDLDGNYELTTQEDAVLVFSFIGYKDQEIPVNGRNKIDVEMEVQTRELEETIVIGYGTVKKSDLTGSVAKITSEDLEKRKVVGVDQILQGVASGVQVTQNSGAPGSSISVKIRGIGTVNSSEPLYVVDGVPISDNTLNIEGIDNKGSIDFLNPNDIESIEVLKDASSTAIYGARGANGVVLITTKKGKKGQTRISADSYYGFQQVTNYIDVLDAREFAKLKIDYDMLTRGDVHPRNNDIANPDNLPAYTNWQEEIFRVAPMQSYQVSVMGGGERSSLLLSANYIQQDGIIKNADYNRLSVRLNSDLKVTKKINIGENFNFSASTRNRIQEGSSVGGPTGSAIPTALAADPTRPVYDSTGTWASITRTKTVNPVGLIERANYTYNTKRLMGNFYGDWEIINNLKFRTNFGLDITWGDLLEFIPQYEVNTFDAFPQSWLKRKDEYWINKSFENTLTYSNTFKDKHDLTILAGVTAQEEIFTDMFIQNRDFPSTNPDMRYISSIPVKEGNENTIIDGNKTEWALFSYLGRLNYSFNNKYLITASVRKDGSSRFGPKKRWGVFPSAAIAWKLHEEDFFNSAIINTCKIRLGWGQIGNQNIGLYQYALAVEPGYNYPLGPDEEIHTGYRTNSVANDEIHWESTESSNIGLDLQFFDSKFALTMDYFNKRTEDMLLRLPVPWAIGISEQDFPYKNSGEVLNKGFEFDVSYKEMETAFSYKLGLNLSVIRNEVIDLGGSEIYSNSIGSDFASVTRENEPVASFYGYKTMGLFQTAEEIENAPFQSNGTAPGDIRYADISGPDGAPDGIIDDFDKTIIGSPLPDFSYGASFDFYYKNFDLSVFLQGVYGNEIYNRFKIYLFSPTLSYNVHKDMLNYWTPENTNTDIPRLAERDKNNNLRISDRFIEDGSYLKIRNITLGYTIPSSIIPKISKLRIYLTIKNALTFTQYSGFDPEIGKSVSWNASPLDIGMDRAVYPQARIFMGGINLNF